MPAYLHMIPQLHTLTESPAPAPQILEKGEVLRPIELRLNSGGIMRVRFAGLTMYRTHVSTPASAPSACAPQPSSHKLRSIT